jgi:lysozyme
MADIQQGIQQSTIDLIKKEEGERLVVYKDTRGLDTVGVGHLVLPSDGLKTGDKITQEQSNTLAKKDLQRFSNAVLTSIKVPISQNQFDALMSLAYNIGETGFKNSTLVKYINANKPQQDITNAWLAWAHPSELMPRRKREVDLYFSQGIIAATAEFVKKKPLITATIIAGLVLGTYILIKALKRK